MNQETTTGSTSEFLDTTTAALTTVAGTSMGASDLSGAVVGGIVAACLTVLLLVMASSIGGCFLYHILHKKNLYALKDNGYQESIGMSFKNGWKIYNACTKCCIIIVIAMNFCRKI